MGKLLKISLFSLFCVSLVFTTSCSSSKEFKPTKQSNPWADDYSSVAKMDSFSHWGPYNVHDPSCLLVGDTYYMYSTDAIWGEDSSIIKQHKLPFGYIQRRESKDLVHWNFSGWVFNEVPKEAREWVLKQSGGVGANNIWAPYILKQGNKFRLYFSVSAFGKQTSYIGVAESVSPKGPWQLRGCVVKTKKGDAMNAIDPSVVTNPVNGEQWMYYGSYFGGLYCVQLNPETGLTKTENDKGALVARRYDGKKNNIEASEVIYNPALKKYFLFVSYDPLMTTYNIRVGRSDYPNGPFTDYFGNDMRKEEDNFPILTYPYRFNHHPGWAGVAHCSVFKGKDGNYYVAHQGRLSPENQEIDLNVRRILWTKDGWPVFSPERYAGDAQVGVKQKDLIGEWEVISIGGKIPERNLEAGQILWGEGRLRKNEVNISRTIRLLSDGSVEGDLKGQWSWKDKFLHLSFDNEEIDLQVLTGHDWENEKRTLLFTGLDKQGHSFWGKRVQ